LILSRRFINTILGSGSRYDWRLQCPEEHAGGPLR
jgi:hypothetical protein